MTLDVIFLMMWTAIVTYELFARKPGPKMFWVVFGGIMIWLHFSNVVTALETATQEGNIQ